MPIAKYLKACSSNTPGVRPEIYLLESSGVTSVTETSDEVSTVTLASATKFKRVQADLDTVQFTQSGEFKTSGGLEQSLITQFSKPSKALNILMQSVVEAVRCGAVAIIVDNNAQAWLWGASGATKDGVTRPINGVSVEMDTGVLITDENMQMVKMTFKRLSGYAPTPFNAAITGEIIAGTSALIDWT